MGYPIMLNLQDKQVIVVGGGTVATRKVQHLLMASARVLVISPDITTDLKSCVDAGQVEWLQATYQRDMMNDYMPLLVIATTDNTRVNQIVAQDARRIRAWVNVVDDSEESDFSNMAVIQQPPITIALSTDGTSPALLKQLKADINASLGDEYAILSQWLGEIRPEITASYNGQSNRRDLYYNILQSDVLTLLRTGDHDRARQTFQQIITQVTHHE